MIFERLGDTVTAACEKHGRRLLSSALPLRNTYLSPATPPRTGRASKADYTPFLIAVCTVACRGASMRCGRSVPLLLSLATRGSAGDEHHFPLAPLSLRARKSFYLGCGCWRIVGAESTCTVRACVPGVPSAHQRAFLFCAMPAVGRGPSGIRWAHPVLFCRGCLPSAGAGVGRAWFERPRPSSRDMPYRASSRHPTRRDCRSLVATRRDGQRV